MKTIIAIAASAALSLPAGQAVAQADTARSTVAVSFADLDLKHDAGRMALERRIQIAIKHICPDVEGPALTLRRQHRACRDAAWTDAKTQLASTYGRSQLAQVAQHISLRSR